MSWSYRRSKDALLIPELPSEPTLADVVAWADTVLERGVALKSTNWLIQLFKALRVIARAAQR